MTWQNQLQFLWLVLAWTMPTHFCTAPPRVTSTGSRGFRIPLQSWYARATLIHLKPWDFCTGFLLGNALIFKIATLTFKLLNFGSPTYLSCLLKPYLPARALRSHGQRLLATPHVKTSIGSRAFRVAAPSVWNALPLHVRSSPSIDVFKRELKTHLFTMKS